MPRGGSKQSTKRFLEAEKAMNLFVLKHPELSWLACRWLLAQPYNSLRPKCEAHLKLKARARQVMQSLLKEMGGDISSQVPREVSESILWRNFVAKAKSLEPRVQVAMARQLLPESIQGIQLALLLEDISRQAVLVRSGWVPGKGYKRPRQKS